MKILKCIALAALAAAPARADVFVTPTPSYECFGTCSGWSYVLNSCLCDHATCNCPTDPPPATPPTAGCNCAPEFGSPPFRTRAACSCTDSYCTSSSDCTHYPLFGPANCSCNWLSSLGYCDCVSRNSWNQCGCTGGTGASAPRRDRRPGWLLALVKGRGPVGELFRGGSLALATASVVAPAEAGGCCGGGAKKAAASCCKG